jgi:ketosteroid isomerase-like protein
MKILVPLMSVLSTAPAQDTYPAKPVPLPDSQEVALAMSGAPAAVSANATIYAVRDGRVITLRAGKHSASCMVSRDLHPGSVYPMCFDAEASRTLLQRELLQNRLRTEGKSEDDVRAATAEAYARGTLKEPTRIAVTYMMSPRQVLFSSPSASGVRAGRWWPHLMISAPKLDAATLGLDADAQTESFSVDSDGDTRKQLIVKVPHWSDGSPRVAAAPAVDLNSARAALLEAEGELAHHGTDPSAHALLRGLAPDAVVVVSRQEPLRTASDIERWTKGDTLAARGMSWYAVRADVSADGRDGYTYGFLVLRGADGVDRPGKYLKYWRRGTDGVWRVLAYKRLPRGPGQPDPIPEGFATPTYQSRRTAPVSRDEAVKQITLTDKEFARVAQQGAAAAFAKYTAPDGATLGSGPSVAYGPQRAAAEFASFPPGSINWDPTHADAAGSGDLGFAIGPVIVKEGNSAARTIGYYLTIWQLQPDGSWKVVIDG